MDLNYFNNSYHFVSFYPEILLLNLVLIFIVYIVFYDWFFRYKIILVKFAGFFLFFSLVLTLLLLSNSLDLNWIVFQSLFLNDIFTSYIKIILITFCCIFTILSTKYLTTELLVKYEYYLLVALNILGLLFLISSYDLISMYLALELQSLCLYILATFKQYNNFSTEAGIKYFILGAFSSGILLFGSSLLYGFTGLTNFYNLELFFSNKFLDISYSNGVFLGILFILIGLFFKLAAAPFHMWSPDVYEGSPTIITAFFAIIPKLAIISVLFKILITILNSHLFYLNYVFNFSIGLSLIIGTLGALYQTKIKRLLAYSAIVHVGFLLLGFATFTLEGFYSTFFYIFVYMLLTLGVFSILLSVRSDSNNMKIKKIQDISLLVPSNIVLSSIFAVLLFSVGGIPPLLGFFSKLYIFMIGLVSQYYIIIIIAALISVISAMYYIRLIKILFFKQSIYKIFLQKISYSFSILIAFIFIINFFFFFTKLNNIKST